jgi:hypothetical protein
MEKREVQREEQRSRKRERADDQPAAADGGGRRYTSLHHSSYQEGSSTVRLVSPQAQERYAAALQSYADAVKKNPMFRGVHMDSGLGPYYTSLAKWMLDTRRVRFAREVAHESSSRLLESLCDFAVEFNSLKLPVEYYSSSAVAGAHATGSGGGSGGVVEKVKIATHSGDWMDVSVPQERKQRR